MDKAVFGLIGVVLGVLLTVAKEFWFQSRKNKKDAEYLAIQIACMLERYVIGCAEVARDDGLYHGQPDSDGYSRIRVSVPKFEPESIEVEWKSLPAHLMYEVLSLPNEIEIANSRIDAVFDCVALPPELEEGFEERQYQYALLGIKASKLASMLRKHANLPERMSSDWDPVKIMEEQKLKIDTCRERMRCQSSMIANQNMAL